MINKILGLILLTTIIIHIGPFLKGFYDGFRDAHQGKPPKNFEKEK